MKTNTVYNESCGIYVGTHL